jgi:hypothetical protein
MPITKATILAWWANLVSGGLMLGGTWIVFFDDHYRGIGAAGVLIGAVTQYYFKDKALKEQRRHNKAMEKRNDTRSPKPINKST